jgi:hypothetical protein
MDSNNKKDVNEVNCDCGRWAVLAQDHISWWEVVRVICYAGLSVTRDLVI